MIPSSDCHDAQRTLGYQVVNLRLTIAAIIGQRRPAIQRILDHLGGVQFHGECETRRLEPPLHVIKQRHSLRLPDAPSFFWGPAANVVLHAIERAMRSSASLVIDDGRAACRSCSFRRACALSGAPDNGHTRRNYPVRQRASRRRDRRGSLCAKLPQHRATALHAFSSGTAGRICNPTTLIMQGAAWDRSCAPLCCSRRR
ncbi:hypothetical protein P3T21_005366 [Paraburkholderia sp. GAS334]